MSLTCVQHGCESMWRSVLLRQSFLPPRPACGQSPSGLRVSGFSTPIRGVFSPSETFTETSGFNILTDKQLRNTFDRFDKNKDGRLSEEEIVTVLVEGFDFQTPEARRVFTNLDVNNEGWITFEQFTKLVRRSKHLRTIVGSTMVDKDGFKLTDDYPFNTSTNEAHKHPAFRPSPRGTKGVYSLNQHGPLVGDYVDVRKMMDYSWHTNFTEERQLWQDQVVKAVTGGHVAVSEVSDTGAERPWLIFTCGAMGSGKANPNPDILHSY